MPVSEFPSDLETIPSRGANNPEFASARLPSAAREAAYFIGVDSDGTVFDSMEIKHKRVFQPLAVEVWGLHSLQAEFNNIAETINLYSTHRGVNRFQGLVMAFERLAQTSEEGRKASAGCEDLREFVLSGLPLSTRSLEEYNKTKQSPFLYLVLEWSRLSDIMYAQITFDEGLPSYPRVRESLERAALRADIMVVSSSVRAVLMQEWHDAGLIRLTKRVMGQETGNKAAQLKSAIRGDIPCSRALMVGDAMGDLEAARANGILFYPILPGAERQSWERFETEAMNRFFQNTYAGDYQRSLLDDFERALRPDNPWPQENHSRRPLETISTTSVNP